MRDRHTRKAIQSSFHKAEPSLEQQDRCALDRAGGFKGTQHTAGDGERQAGGPRLPPGGPGRAEAGELGVAALEVMDMGLGRIRSEVQGGSAEEGLAPASSFGNPQGGADRSWHVLLI